MGRFDLAIVVQDNVKMILTKQAFNNFCRDIYDKCLDGEKNSGQPFIELVKAEDFEQYPEDVIPPHVGVLFLAYNFTCSMTLGTAFDFLEQAVKENWLEKLEGQSKEVLNIFLEDCIATAINNTAEIKFTLVFV